VDRDELEDVKLRIGRPPPLDGDAPDDVVRLALSFGTNISSAMEGLLVLAGNRLRRGFEIPEWVADALRTYADIRDAERAEMARRFRWMCSSSRAP
jgi:hypothetical protein